MCLVKVKKWTFIKLRSFKWALQQIIKSYPRWEYIILYLGVQAECGSFYEFLRQQQQFPRWF